MQKRKKAEVNHVCSRCKYIRKVPSLFPDFEVIECSNGCYKTLEIIPSGGVMNIKWKTSPAWCPKKQEEK